MESRRLDHSPRDIKVACDHEGLTHVGGIHFFHEFVRVLQLRNFLATHLTYPRRNNHYHLSQIISDHFRGSWPCSNQSTRTPTSGGVRSGCRRSDRLSRPRCAGSALEIPPSLQ